MSKQLYIKKNVKVFATTQFNHKTIFEKNIRISKNVAIGGAFIGRNSYIGQNSVFTKCKIGRFCSISNNVKVISCTHPVGFVSTSPTFYSVLNQNGQSFVYNNMFNEHLSIDGYDAVIGDDVWIGSDVKIKGGVRIGSGSIIAMGAVVTKDVPPYAIVGGVPAQIIRYRFTQNQIEKILKINWWNKSDEWLRLHVEEFKDIDVFIEKYYDEDSNNSSSL